MENNRFAIVALTPVLAGQAAAIAATAPDPWSREAIDAVIDNPHRLCLAALEDELLLGFACFFTVEDATDLEMVAVHPASRRHGAANALLLAGEEALRAAGSERILLEVRVSNTAAITLYQKLGYRRLAVRPGMYQRPVEDGWLMAKTLPAHKGSGA